MVAEDLFAAPVRQWLDGVEPTWTLLTFDSSQAMQCDATICCFARERVDRDKGGRPPDDVDRPRSRSSGRLCGIPVGAYPTADPVPAPSRHLAAALRTASDGRHGRAAEVRGTRQAVQRVASDRPPNTGPAAPAHGRAGQAVNPAIRGPWTGSNVAKYTTGSVMSYTTTKCGRPGRIVTLSFSSTIS